MLVDRGKVKGAVYGTRAFFHRFFIKNKIFSTTRLQVAPRLADDFPSAYTIYPFGIS